MTTAAAERNWSHERLSKLEAGGSLSEGIAGLAALVLAVLGLAGMYPVIMLAAAIIMLGLAMLFQGVTVAAEISTLVHESESSQIELSELGSGLTAGLLGGIAAILLGVLALVEIAPGVILPVAVIVLGAVAVAGSGLTARLNSHRVMARVRHPSAQEIARSAVYAAAGIQLLAGLGALALGILALVSLTNTLQLTLAAVLVLGLVVLLSGTSLAVRIYSLLPPKS